MSCNGARSGLLFEFNALSQSLGADLHSCGETPACGFSSVCIDSRSAREGSLFVALPGAASDGHGFVDAAFRSGAAAAMVNRSSLDAFSLLPVIKEHGKTLIAVDNTLRSLQETARLYLDRFPGLLKIGITGSSGKTTTKEIAAAIIGAEKNVVMNPGNYNSETGLPLAAFEVRDCHEVGIFEMGMNHPGEIADLASILNPHIALITNIGTAHIGILGSIEAIAKEKKEIFSCFSGSNTALIPDDCGFRDYLAAGLRGRASYYGANAFAELGGVRSMGLDGSEILWEGRPVRFALPGKHSLADALAAIAIAREVPVGDEAIRQGLESARPLFGRGEILRGRATVIRDCYNANPESLAGALEFCDSLDWQGRRIYVIGDMLELGEASRKAHEDAGRLLLGSKADMVFLYGKETAAVAEVLRGGAARFSHTCDMDELSRAVGGYVRDGDLVLLKGSRGCALERLCSVLEGAA
ncbi:MAG: UDP-N-acetylmuramoyl-tripeptide--D-alanyl-D-alanine ligase [Treponema sp.]|nr:UDP-N-acetylmuramoyl-tripeptide--D-alanyl-D-alanine ligase [Treponema sp.]